MFQIQEFTEAQLSTVTNRSEKHGDEDKPAVTLGLEITTANTLLDEIEPALREALFKAKDESQETLPDVERSTPVLRAHSIDRVLLPTKHEGWALAVDDGIDDTVPMTFGGCKVDRLTVEPKQGGSIVLRLRVGTSDVDADRLGKLGMHVRQSIWITLLPPEKAADAIDGTQAAFEADHPDATDAGDLFAHEHGADPDDGDDEAGGADSEGGDTDVQAGSQGWPFPRDADSDATTGAPPQSVTIERSQPGTRTARGREKTAKALAEGAPK